MFARNLLFPVLLFALTGCPPGPVNAPPAPLISPAFTTQTCPFTVTITNSASGNVIFYTTDGSSPQTSPTKIQYQAPFTVPQNRAETVQAVAGVLGQQNLVFGPIASVSYTCGNVLPQRLVAVDLSTNTQGPVTTAANSDLLVLQPNVGISSSANGQVLWCATGTIDPRGPCTTDFASSTIDPINPLAPQGFAAFVPPNLAAGTYNVIVNSQSGAFLGYITNFTVTAAPKISVLTQRYNNQRTGANIGETILTTQTVGSPAFQKLYQINVDGDVYAQPLLVSNVVMNDGSIRDILLVATMNNTLFALAVDNGYPTTQAAPPQLLWKVNFGTPVAANFMPLAGTADTCFTSAICLPNGNHDTPDAAVPVLPSPANCCPPNFNINPKIGILSTPAVIAGEAAGIQDKGAAVYGEAEVWNGTAVDHHLWSVKLLTGAIINNVILTGTSPASNGSVAFSPNQQMQRPALLAGARSHIIYVAFGSHADTRPWHGWIFAFQGDAQGDIQNPAGLSGPAIWTTTSTGLGGSIWQGGSGLAEDDVNNTVYAMTGNGEESTEGTQSSDIAFPTTSACMSSPNLADSFVSLTSVLTVNGCFAPSDDGPMSDGHSREAQDLDVSSSGPVKIPGTSALIGGEKEGLIFVLNTASQLALSQSFLAAKPRDGFTVQGSGYHHIHGTPALWKNANGVITAYVWPERDYLRAYSWDKVNDVFDCLSGSGLVPCQGPSGNTQPVQISTIENPDCSFGTLGCSKMPGGILSISANGGTSGSAIVWASVPIDTDALYRVVPGVLRAFNAENLQQEVWDSQMHASRDGNFNFAKFAPPLVGNGRVYMATFSNAVNVYGLCPSSSPCPVATVGP